MRKNINLKRAKILLFLSLFYITALLITKVVAAEELPDDGARISSSQIIQTKTGTAPFDQNDDAGNDSSENNNVVRSFDQVSWTIENTMTLNGDSAEGYMGGRIYFEAKMPSDKFNSETFKWDLSSMKWIEDPSVSSDGLTLTGYYQMGTGSITVPGKQSLVFIGKILGAANGTEFSPEITLWLNGNTEEEYKKVIPEKIVVSAIPKINMVIRNNSKLSTKKTLDFNGESVTGRVYGYGIMLELYNDSPSKGLKGIEYPQGKITFEIDTQLEKISIEDTNNTENITPNCIPRLWDYKVNTTESKGVLQRDMTFGNIVRGYSFRLLPLGKRTGDGLDSVCNSGNVTMTQDGSKIYVTIDNYAFDGIFPRYFYPYERTGIIYTENRGAFSSMYFEIVIPDNEYSLDEMSNYYLTTTLSNLSATSISGKKVTTQPRTDDDMQRVQHVILRKGTYNQDNRFRSNDFKRFLSSPYGAGNSFAPIGSTIVAWVSTIAGNSNDDENALYTVNKLVKFDADCYEPIKTGDRYYTTSQAENVGKNFGYKMWFVTKRDGTNWKDEKERNNARVEDLILYENYQDIPQNYLCVGEYFETQDGYLVTGYQIIDIRLKIKDTAKIGETYGIMHNTIAWNESLDRNIYTATNKNVEWPKPVYDTSRINYLKTNYDENFNIIKGTHNGGNVYGQTILVVGADLSVSKKAIINENEEKINYDFSKNEYDVTYKIDTTLKNPAINGKGVSGVNVKCEDTLPVGISYVAGSSNIGEPEIIQNENGTTKLIWYLNDLTVNETINPIVYKAHILEDLGNGTILQSQTRVEEVPSIGEKGEEVYKIGKIPSTNSSSRISITSINIINLASHRLYKSISTPVIEKNGDIHFTLTYKNNTDESIPDFQLLDILPYNGDSRGSSFDGTYTLDKLEVNQENTNGKILSNDNISVYYTEDKEIVKSASCKDENLVNDWKKTNTSNINKEASAFAIKGEIGPQGKVIVDIYLKTNDNTSSNKYVNNATAQIYKTTEEIVTSNALSQVIQRKIEGFAWEDLNLNGLKDDNELPLDKVELTLTDSYGKQVVDINGKTVTPVTTDEKGYYFFDNLPQGKYFIRVKNPNMKYILTEKNVGSNDSINSKFYEDTMLTDQITKLDTSNIPSAIAQNQNAGFIKKETNVIVNYKEIDTKEDLYEQINISGRIDDYYSTEDKIDEINEVYENKYEFLKTDGNVTGTMEENTIYITYWYQKKNTNVIVKYVDVDTNEEIINHEEIIGRIDEDYITKDKIAEINETSVNKYVLVKTTDNIKGKMEIDTIEVIYYYKKVEAQAIVKFVDEDSGEEIDKREYIGGFVGDDYKTEPKDIKEYDLVVKKIPENKNGKLTEDIIEIIYYYKKRPVPINTGDIALGVIIFVALICVFGVAYVICKYIRNKK